MRHEMNEAGLVKGCLAGEADSQGKLVREYLRMVLSITWRFTRDESRAEDLCQEVFERVFRNLGGFRGESALSTWIYSIAVSHCINSRQKLSLESACIEDAGVTESQDPTPEQEAIIGEMSTAVHQAVNSLPEKYRAVMILSAFDDRTAGDISNILRIPVGTVFSRLNKGRDILRKKLSGFIGGGKR